MAAVMTVVLFGRPVAPTRGAHRCPIDPFPKEALSRLCPWIDVIDDSAVRATAMDAVRMVGRICVVLGSADFQSSVSIAAEWALYGRHVSRNVSSITIEHRPIEIASATPIFCSERKT